MRAVTLLIILLLVFLSGCVNKEEREYEEKTLTIYTGEAFYSAGLWSEFDFFEARYDCKLRFVNFDDPYLALQQLIAEGDSTEADLICGINSALVNEAINSGRFEPYKSRRLSSFDKDLVFDKSGHFIPYACGYLAFLYDSRYIKKPPGNYGELQDNRWDDTIVMPHPIKTGIGRAFLHQSAGKYGKNGFRYLWKGIRKNILVYEDSYSAACNRFLAGEGHIMPGYTTLPLYFSEDNNPYIESVIFEEGSSLVTECAGITVSSREKELSKRFIDYLLSEEFQARIPSEKWLYRIDQKVSFDSLFGEINMPSKDKLTDLSLGKVKSEESVWKQKIKKTLEFK